MLAGPGMPMPPAAGTVAAPGYGAALFPAVRMGQPILPEGA